MVKKFILIGAVVSLIFILGCKTGGDRSNINLDYKAIHTGSEGITLDFLPNLPPEKVMEGNSYNMGLRLANRGAYDVKEGEGFFTFRGDKSDIDIKNPYQAISLKGKSLLNPKGEETINADYAMDVLKIKENDTKKKESFIFIDLCYKYKTEAIANICIDTDVYSLSYREKVCKIKDISLSSQGAPIAVTGIKQNMVPVGNAKEKLSPEFEVTIANVGKGTPFYKPAFTEAICKGTLAKNDFKDSWNSVEVMAEIEGSGLRFECNGDSQGTRPVRLDKQKTFICRTLGGIDAKIPPYTSILKINIDYAYISTISKKIEIEKFDIR